MKLEKSFLIALIAASLAFACIALLPHALQRVESEFPFQGIEIMPGDAEYYYAARVKEVHEGHWMAADAYRTTKDHPFMKPTLPEAIIALPSRILGGDPVSWFVFSKGFFAIVLLVTFTGLLATITKRPWESLAASTAVFVAGSALSSPWNLFAFLADPNFNYGFLRFTRPINPQWSATLVFLTLWLLASWVSKRENWKIITASIVTAISLYSYFYSWTYIGAVCALLLAWFMWKRDKDRVRDLLKFAALFFVLGIPYFISLYQTTHYAFYPESAIRLGMVEKREVVLGVWIFVFVILSVITKCIWPKTWPILPVLSLGGLIALNQQLITGKYIVPHHYHWYFIFPLAAATFVILALGLIKVSKQTKDVIIIAVIVLSVFFGGMQQYKAYAQVRNDWGERQVFTPVFDEIGKHPGQVIYANTYASLLPDLIPVYTSSDVYTAANANLFMGPLERERDTFFFEMWIQGLTPEEASDRFYADLKNELSGRIYSIYYRELLGSYLDIPDEVVAEHIKAYSEFYALSLEEKLNLYPLDIVIITPWDEMTEEWEEVLGDVIWEKDGYVMAEVKRESAFLE